MPDVPQLGGAHKMSPFDAWCLAIGCVIGWGSFSMPAATFLPAAGPLGTGIALFAGAAIVVVIALNYWFMMCRQPVEGGAYVYAKRTFGPRHGFICAWSLILAYLALVPFNASALALIERDLLGGFLQAGPCYSLAGYDVYLLEIAVEVAVLVVAVALIARGKRLAKYVQMTMGVALVVCVVSVAAGGIAVSAAQGASALPAFSPSVAPLPGMLAVLAVAPWAFVGFDAIPQTAGAMGFSPRKAGGLMASVIIVAAFMYVGLDTLTAMAVPEGYESWAAYIADAPNLTGLMSHPTFYAAYATFGQAGYTALVVAVFCAVVMGIVGFSLVVSRLVFVMAQDGALPAWLASTNANGSPVNALAFVAVVSLVAILIGRTALSWIVDVSSAGAAVAFLYTSIAALENARAYNQRGRMGLGLAGALLSAAFLVLLLVPIPGVGGTLGAESYVVLVTWIALGINFYNPAASS